MKNEKRIDSLILSLEEKHWRTQQQASKELVEIGTPAVPKLLDALFDPNNGVNAAVGIVLGNIKSLETVPILIKACSSTSKNVRSAAILALGKIGDKSALSTIIEALNTDEDETVRIIACDALGMIGDSSAISALIEALRKTQNKRVYPLAGAALSTIGEPSLPSLFDALKDDSFNDDAREAVSTALKAIGEPAVPGLLRLLKVKNTKWYVPLTAAIILGHIGNDAAISGLQQALSGDNEKLSEIAYEVLEQIGTSEALQLLAEWDLRNRKAP